MRAERWEDIRRLEAWAGEVRVNLIRAVALVVFFAYHLLQVHFLDPAMRGSRFDVVVTMVVLTWALGVAVLHTCLSRRWMPPALKYAVTAWDLTMITALLLADKTGGPHSPLVVLYFLVIAAAPLRLSLRLVCAATLGAMVAAMLMMGCYVWGVVGSADYYAPDSRYLMPRTHEVIFLLALAVAGLLAGQAVRQARRLSAGYPVVVVPERNAA
jgi:hypothetical protein